MPIQLKTLREDAHSRVRNVAAQLAFGAGVLPAQNTCARCIESLVNTVKRVGNLYQNICKVENIIAAFDEVCRNTKNKGKVYRYKKLKCINIRKVYDTLIHHRYVVGDYNRFVIYEPKRRNVVSQGMFDKVVNHLVARHILIPAIEKGLIDANVASRLDGGTGAGLKLFRRFNRICEEKYQKFYVLKCDIKNFFGSINHDILKDKLKRKIKDKDALQILFDIIDSEECGLGIGNMTSQILAVFYLDAMDKYIKEVLKIKYYVRYQDDFLLWHESKEYLRFCLEKIRVFLEKEGLTLNGKTRIFSGKENFIYLGRDKFGKYARRRRIRRRIKKQKFLYESGKINLMGFVSCVVNYRALLEKR